MSSNPPTRLLYQEQGDLHEYDAHITSIETLPADQAPDSHALFLDETIFHVQGGGQPFDVGTITSLSNPGSGSSPTTFNVTAVRHAENERVRHIGSFTSTSTSPFPPKTAVQLSICPTRRLLNSRIHTAGHILGLAIRSLSRSGALPSNLSELKAQHYPDAAFVEFRGTIEGKHKDAIQQATDEIVGRAAEVRICFWGRDECVRNGVVIPDGGGVGMGVGDEDEDGDGRRKYRAVLIEGCGAYPCGGTHVKDTAAVGSITVRRISRQKGCSKVSYAVS